ncbi:holo-[acyl-carrier-protein] synthase [Lysinibacillus sp. 2017]|uniref:holo-ACP synthase n=1 Tax=unclassified Lysinibacillus TaxID=2636778 RepID=UPI000D527887|nr:MULTISPECIES: holo-ACP synthase [unclassified Lysinibacillus]AWE08918.1 holo-[acyl-carrier-protein] synthase [Lysinibacillus sp. 2017]TGN35571.1 holo-[acyl-carrier-protein] synthase [Lysinibacillus sp. S2017]
MIKGIGLDLVELARIEKMITRSEKFQQRILTLRELAIFETLSPSRKVEFLAGRFAAKEAYSKANGTGIGEGCELHQIEILKDEIGKPILYFNGMRVNGFISITHTHTTAAAQVILMN